MPVQIKQLNFEDNSKNDDECCKKRLKGKIQKFQQI